MENTQSKNQLVNASQNVFKTALAKQQETYTNMLSNTLSDMNLNLDNYKKVCVINCIQKMNEMLTSQGLSFKDIDQGTITQILTKVAMLELNIASSPRECYLQFRNTKVGDKWKKNFEFGIEGDGNDKILRKYGVNVKEVKGPYIVRQDDEFTYPWFDGEEMKPLTWKPKSYYKSPIKVFYIVIKNDGSKEFLVAEREDVVHNLQAHIKNNMLKVDDSTKNQILKKISTMSLENILDDESLRTYISPAWFDAQSRDAMIERKMKNNATKKYPKDFKSAFVESTYESTFDDYDQYREQNKKSAIDIIDNTETPSDVQKEVDEKIDVKTISSNENVTSIPVDNILKEEATVTTQDDDDDMPF